MTIERYEIRLPLIVVKYEFSHQHGAQVTVQFNSILEIKKLNDIK
jgi:hypothetical protein